MRLSVLYPFISIWIILTGLHHSPAVNTPLHMPSNSYSPFTFSLFFYLRAREEGAIIITPLHHSWKWENLHLCRNFMKYSKEILWKGVRNSFLRLETNISKWKLFSLLKQLENKIRLFPNCNMQTPPPSEVITFLWKMRNVMNRMKKRNKWKLRFLKHIWKDKSDFFGAFSHSRYQITSYHWYQITSSGAARRWTLTCFGE